jgi:hypothetical protein
MSVLSCLTRIPEPPSYLSIVTLYKTCINIDTIINV